MSETRIAAEMPSRLETDRTKKVAIKGKPTSDGLTKPESFKVDRSFSADLPPTKR